MKTLNEQNQIITFDIPNGTAMYKPMTTHNNLYSVNCVSKSGVGEAIVKTYSGTVTNDEAITLHFNGIQQHAMEDINIKIVDRVEINNQTNQHLICNVLVNDYAPNRVQTGIQDYGLGIINFFVIIFLWCLPFLILILQLKSIGLARIKQKLSFNKKQVGEK